MESDIFILLLSCIANLLLAGFVYFKNPKSKINVFFSGSVLMLVLWNVSVIFARLTNGYVLWIKSAYFFSIAALLLFLFFLKYFPSPRLPFSEIIFYLLVILGIISLCLIYPTRFLVKLDPSIKYTQQLNPDEIFGVGVDFYLYYLIFYIIFVLFSFLSKYKKANKIEKNQIRLTAAGILIFMFLAILTNLLIPRFFNIDLGNIGPAFSFIMVGFIGYAIERYKLFELKVIAAEIIIVLIWTILLVQIIVAENTFWKVVGGIVLITFSILGYSLVKSIYKEIEFREKLQKAYRELQQLDKAKTEFISIASHQLRTPLTAIKGYVSLLIEGSYGKISSKAKAPLKNIYKTNEQLIKLVNNLLDISRIESGRTTLNFQEVSLEKVINEIIEELKTEVDKKGLYIKFKKPDFVPKIIADREKIKQIFLNLIDNAIKYTFKGGVIVSIEPQTSEILVKIMDTGIGMEKQDFSSLFKSFKRGKGGSKTWAGGAGIGVYIAKKFVDAHHGKIWAESKGKNKGTTFYVKLPLDPKNSLNP